MNMQRNHSVAKASSLGGAAVDTAVLTIDQEIDPGSNTHAEFYDDQAERVLDVLDVLPQGTRYALLCKMLAKAPIFYRGV